MPIVDIAALNVVERLPGWWGRYFHSEHMDRRALRLHAKFEDYAVSRYAVRPMSRCTPFTLYPPRFNRLLISSAIITERCCPPVHPNAIVR